jgi:hypothetical protein
MRQRLASIALLSVLAIASPWILAADGARQSAPRVTMFGDSVADSLSYVPDARGFLGDGLDLRLELTPCRKLVAQGCAYMGARPSSVLDVVKASTPAGLGDVVVVDVGYNDPENNYDSDMGTVVSALLSKGVQRVVWVTMREASSDYSQINDIIRDRARREPRITVADWEAASRGKPWFNPDGLHLNADGAFALAALLRPYVLAACGSTCVAQGPTAPDLPRDVRPPSLRGTPAVGSTLTCSPGRWTGARPIVFSYHWLRNWSPIRSDTAPTKVVRKADRGRSLACRVWAANTSGATSATSRAVVVGQKSGS